MSEPTRRQQAASAILLAAGTEKHLSGIPVMPIDGDMSPPATVVATLHELAKTEDEVEHAKAAYETALAKANAQRPTMTAYTGAVVRFVRAAFGNDPAVLVDFGIAPIKPRTPLTVEEKAAAIAKNEATRKARGTMGPRQRLAIHGSVTGVEITPVEGPSPATATPVEAPAK